MQTMNAVRPATFVGRIGLAQVDITPPAGINSRVWGAATHEIAQGVHMPLKATAMAVISPSGSPYLLVSADASWIGAAEDWRAFRLAIAEAVGISGQVDRVLFSLTHTHAAPPLEPTRQQLPGGDLIGPYMQSLRDALAAAASGALANAVEAQLTVDRGSCSLATNRDLPLDDKGHFACGFNPNVIADSTLLVARITDLSSGEILGTIVNYACHPTTLAWENKLISPDYVGSLRALVEAETNGAPCLFLQGASGELSARQCHQGDTAVAERQGRQLGYAVLSTLEGMIPPGNELDFAGIKESGARLAYWRPVPLTVSPAMAEVVAREVALPLPIKADWPGLVEFERMHAESTDRVLKERYFRRIGSRRRVGDGSHFAMGFAFWRLGDLIIATSGAEMYSAFQVQVRAAFPDAQIMVCNLVNGSAGYVVPADRHVGDLYQADLTPFDPSSLDASVDFATTQIRDLMA